MARRLLSSTASVAGAWLTGRTAKVGLGLVGAACLAAKACEEEVPYGARRRRYALPEWLLPAYLRPSTPKLLDIGELLSVADLCVKVSEAGAGGVLVPVQPGEVHISWLGGTGPGGSASVAPEARALLERAARVAAAAIAQEVEQTGCGRHTQEWGWRILVVPPNPADSHLSAQLFSQTLVLPTSVLDDCVRNSQGSPLAALTFMIAHEMGHCVAGHVTDYITTTLTALPAAYVRTLLAIKRHDIISSAVAWGDNTIRRHRLLQALWPDGRAQLAGIAEAAGVRCEQDTARAWMQYATASHQLSWHHEFEADEVACAALMRAGVPVGWVADGLRVLGQWECMAGSALSKELAIIIRRMRQAGRAEQQRLAARLGLQSLSDVERVQHTLQTGSADDVTLQRLQLMVTRLASVVADEAAEAALTAASLRLRGMHSFATAGPSPAVAAAAAEAMQLGKRNIQVGHDELPLFVFVACPEASRRALLMALACTHPLTEARTARVAELAWRLDMQQRRAAPPLQLASQHQPVWTK